MSNQITEADFEKELGYFTLQDHVFKEIVPRPYPSKPFLFSEYQKKTFSEKAKISPDFWLRPDISSYLIQKNQIITQNKTHVENLKKLQTAIPAGDAYSHAKIRERLIDFEVYRYEL